MPYDIRFPLLARPRDYEINVYCITSVLWQAFPYNVSLSYQNCTPILMRFMGHCDNKPLISHWLSRICEKRKMYRGLAISVLESIQSHNESSLKVIDWDVTLTIDSHLVICF